MEPSSSYPSDSSGMKSGVSWSYLDFSFGFTCFARRSKADTVGRRQFHNGQIVTFMLQCCILKYKMSFLIMYF